MFIYFGTPLPLSTISEAQVPLSKVRSSQQVLVIDDEPFTYLASLSGHGFSIREVRDLDSVEFVEKFPIVICDVKGVGKKLGGRHEGAHLGAEIRRHYPDKYIIAYTGYTFDPTYNELLASTDRSLAKDIDTEDWVRELDAAAKVMSNPRSRWLRMRRHLLQDAQLELWSVFRLEQALIRACEKGNQHDFAKQVASAGLPNDIGEMLISFGKGLFADIVVTAAIAAVS